VVIGLGLKEWVWSIGPIIPFRERVGVPKEFGWKVWRKGLNGGWFKRVCGHGIWETLKTLGSFPRGFFGDPNLG